MQVGGPGKRKEDVHAEQHLVVHRHLGAADLLQAAAEQVGGDRSGDPVRARTFRRQHLFHPHRHLGHGYGVQPADASGEFRTKQAALVAVDLAVQELRVVVHEVADPSGLQRITEGEVVVEKPHLFKRCMLQDLPGDPDAMDERGAGAVALAFQELHGHGTVGKRVLGAVADHGLEGVQDLQNAHAEGGMDCGRTGFQPCGAVGGHFRTAEMNSATVMPLRRMPSSMEIP